MQKAVSQHSVTASACLPIETPHKPSRLAILQTAQGCALAGESLVPAAPIALTTGESVNPSPLQSADSDLFSLVSTIKDASERHKEAVQRYNAIEERLKARKSAEEIELQKRMNFNHAEFARLAATTGHWGFPEVLSLRAEWEAITTKKSELEEARKTMEKKALNKVDKAVCSTRGKICKLLVRLSKMKAFTLDGIIAKADLYQGMDDLFAGCYFFEDELSVHSIFEDIRALRA